MWRSTGAFGFPEGVVELKTPGAKGAQKEKKTAMTVSKKTAWYVGVEVGRWKGARRHAAENGDADAQTRLGIAYLFGDGVRADSAKAVLWFRRAAEQGDALAQRLLGEAYATGEGVPLDRVQAVSWFRQAAEQGDEDAQHKLDEMCV